jgi:homogentisate phytyltransferase/homogentisate geranylgeranyltransferase
MITFLRFARAHTLIGTSLSIVTLYLIALRMTGNGDWKLLALTLLSCLAANVYITGLNQVTDVEIDKITKPYLPIASGAYTMKQAKWIIFACLTISLAVAVVYPTYLLTTVVVSVIIGTAYSLPPIRLKRFHFWAAFCVLSVRGLIVNLLLFLHFQVNMGGGDVIPPVIWLLTGIIFTFSIIIAWYKDLPDTEGDAAFQIDTLSLKWGRNAVWRAGMVLLSITFVAAAVIGFRLQSSNVGYGQLGLLVLLVVLGYQLNLKNQKSIARYYQGIWVLFFLEYGIFAAFG